MNASAVSPLSTGPGALAGLRILDLTKFWAGPAMTALFGAMGAEVIKIEAIQAVDFSRMGGARLVLQNEPGKPLYEGSPMFNPINVNKYGLTLDLTRARGQEIFKRMVASADIVAENYTPRVMPKFGLGYESLREIRPDLVMISLPGFGLTGPWRDFVSFAYPTEQATGFPHLTGYRDGPPSLWGPAGADAFAGMNGAVAVMAALEYRRRTGKGQHIDLSQVEAINAWLGQQMIDHSWNDRAWPRTGNRHEVMAPQGLFRSSGEDRWIAISVEDDAAWQSLCRAINRADWAERPDLATADSRQAAHDELDIGIEAWTSQLDQREAAGQLQAAGVAAAPVLGGADLINDPQLQARDHIDWVDRKWVGKAPYGGSWAKFSGTPGSTRMPAPLLGEHNAFILKGLLDMPDDELAELEAEGIIGVKPA